MLEIENMLYGMGSCAIPTALFKANLPHAHSTNPLREQYSQRTSHPILLKKDCTTAQHHHTGSQVPITGIREGLTDHILTIAMKLGLYESELSRLRR